MSAAAVITKEMSEDGRDINIYDTFDEMDLNELLLRGIYAFGYEKPSSIQKRAIVPVTRGFDIIAQSQSGTGKTATFAIGSLSTVDTSLNEPQILVLSPTRELARQNYDVFKGLSEYLDVSINLCIGGQSISDNVRDLDKGGQVIVGTPGRVFDLLKKHILNGSSIKSFILDEADEMLSRGFRDQIHDVFVYLSKSCQVCLFSATMPSDVLELTDKFMNEPISILIPNEELTLEGIKQYWVGVEKDIWKFETLCDIYEGLTVNQAIIYCNRKRKADWLTQSLREKDFTVACIHSDMTQKERSEVIDAFKSGVERILIATDIVARGIDVQQVSLVINYDMPKYKETYIHRIGRSGRYGRKGLAINLLVGASDFSKLEELQTFYMTKIDEMPMDLASL